MTDSGRHDDEAHRRAADSRQPLAISRMAEQLAAAMRAATPTARQLASAWTAAVKPRPPVREEEMVGLKE